MWMATERTERGRNPVLWSEQDEPCGRPRFLFSKESGVMGKDGQKRRGSVLTIALHGGVVFQHTAFVDDSLLFGRDFGFLFDRFLELGDCVLGLGFDLVFGAVRAPDSQLDRAHRMKTLSG